MELKAGYKQTEVGVIPEDWIVKPLLTAVRVASGQVDPRNEPFRSMVLVAPDHIEGATGRLLNKVSAGDQRAISGKYLFAAGDIVYSKIRPYLRKAILADFPGLCSADMYPLKPVTDVSGGFVFASILAHQFSIYAESVSVRSGMPKINRGEMAEYSMAFPPTKAEQEAIAEALSDADALIESLDQLIAKKRQIKQGTMQELLTGKRRLPGFGGEWEVKRLAELADIRSGGTPSTTQPQFWDGGVLWCTPTDITALGGFKYLSSTTRTISVEGLKASSAEIIPVHSIVMTSRATIGECAINTVRMTTNQGFKNFVPFDGVDTEFLYYLLITQRQEFIGLCSGSTFLEIGKTQLAAYQVRVPDTKAEQTAIATLLSDMDTELAALESRFAKARHIKQGMMQELLTGRIRLLPKQ